MITARISIKKWMPWGICLSVWSHGCVPPGNDNSIPDTVPDFSAARFTNSIEINNPFFPLAPGASKTYTGETPEGTERIVIDVLDDTRQVMGIATRIVRDRAYLNDLLIEDTRDWFAQDDNGNVWYMGEEVDDYIYDDQGNFVEIVHEGVWEAGLDVSNVGAIARPGHIMKATPMLGDVYNQEYYSGEAEDMGEVIAIDVPITLANGTTYSCVQIRDFTPLEPAANEYKFYAPGVGLVVEQVVGSSERVELIDSDCKAATPDTEISLPIAPASSRVDLEEPTFTNPTNLTNPLIPISDLHSVLLLGFVDGIPFRTETTLLTGTQTIELNGSPVETLISQYVAYLDGRIEEVALDWYAQADDGSVWYFGEDVFNYEDGVIADTEGTWLTCRDGPVAMIMPANPQVDDVYRPENVFGVVFEEVVVRSINQTVDGPQGPVTGAILVEELHSDGTYEDKVFAPGYGEFSTGSGDNIEALALAVPTDALSEPTPAELESLSFGAVSIFDAAQSEDWTAATVTLIGITSSWNTYQLGQVPERIRVQLNDGLDALSSAINARDSVGARQASTDVDQSSLDLQLRYRPVMEIDLARLDVWTRRLLIDSDRGDAGGVAGDVTVLEWIWDRVDHAVADADASRIRTQLGLLRAAADAESTTEAARAAMSLRELLGEVSVSE